MCSISTHITTSACVSLCSYLLLLQIMCPMKQKTNPTVISAAMDATMVAAIGTVEEATDRANNSLQ